MTPFNDEFLFITEQNPYRLDYMQNGEFKAPALTRKNADFIEAVVGLDSNYAKDNIVTKVPSDGYNPEINATKSNGMYCGSSAYWFNEMQKPGADFSYCLLGAIIAVDITNSTHLEASDNGRKVMREIICSKCSNVDDLKKRINIPFKADNKEHLISLMCRRTATKKKDSDRYNLSFATKFCSYAAKYLKCNIEYPKYDNVVSDALPDYMNIYLKEITNKRYYKINDYEQRQFKDDEIKMRDYRLNIYQRYNDDILKIVSNLKAHNINITIEEFDHIIWYGFKG